MGYVRFSFVLSMLFACLTPQAFALSTDCTAKDKSIQEQAKKVDCQLRNIAQHINEDKETVPKTIYHFGKEAHMMENVNARTIPQESWDKFIMTQDNRFKLNNNRQGFYGTSGIDSNGFGGGEFDWIVEIHIKDECRKPENVITFIDMIKNKKFINWFDQLPSETKFFANVTDFENNCYRQEGRPAMGYKGNMPSSNCENLVNNYIYESKAKIIQDHEITKAFYLRDRNCIETIQGKPKEIIEIAAKREFMWLTPCKGDYNVGSGQFSRIVIASLARYEEEVPAAVIEKLKNNFTLAQKPTKQLDLYEKCRSAGKLSEFRDKYKNFNSDNVYDPGEAANLYARMYAASGSGIPAGTPPPKPGLCD